MAVLLGLSTGGGGTWIGLAYRTPAGSWAPFLRRSGGERRDRMGDTSVTKVESGRSPKGSMGQRYLASGIHVAMRLWEKEPAGEAKPARRRDYETVGYVIEGRA